MAIWDKLKDGIDKANKVAQDALDEGKIRLDARKARQSADKAAESLGYAMFRAWERGRELEPESLDGLARTLRDHEQEAVRLEKSIDDAGEWRRKQAGEAGTSHDPASDTSAPATPPNSDPSGDGSSQAPMG